ncbi:hypothetical protein EGU81_27340, partial [Pseudomonas syringae pv. theae]|nr:hypothetical protein [Pseudomonas syringae pv. theae]
ASHTPDQRQSSAATHVALCVVSAIAVKKLFFNYRATLRVACGSGRSASDLESLSRCTTPEYGAGACGCR